MAKTLTRRLTIADKKNTPPWFDPRRGTIYDWGFPQPFETLFNVFAGVLRQLKHRRRAFSTEKGLEQMIRINVTAVLFVL